MALALQYIQSLFYQFSSLIILIILQRQIKVPREKLWITTKASDEGRGDLEKSINQSLHLLHLDYVDLFLIHTPFDIDLQGMQQKRNEEKR